MTTQSFLYLFLLIISLVISIFLYNRYDVEAQKKIQEAIRAREDIISKLKFEYEVALKSGNKIDALKCGRAYYEFKGESSKFSELKIANDLASMDKKQTNVK